MAVEASVVVSGNGSSGRNKNGTNAFVRLVKKSPTKEFKRALGRKH
jgi:hypothetical protein